jgi:hypothetical protein
MAKKGYRFYVDKDPTGTIYLQSKTTGKLRGRRVAKKGEKSDKILNIRVKEPGEASGQIYGFLPAGKKTIPVKADSNKRATLRRSL